MTAILQSNYEQQFTEGVLAGVLNSSIPPLELNNCGSLTDYSLPPQLNICRSLSDSLPFTEFTFPPRQLSTNSLLQVHDSSSNSLPYCSTPRSLSDFGGVLQVHDSSSYSLPQCSTPRSSADFGGVESCVVDNGGDCELELPDLDILCVERNLSVLSLCDSLCLSDAVSLPSPKTGEEPPFANTPTGIRQPAVISTPTATAPTVTTKQVPAVKSHVRNLEQTYSPPDDSDGMRTSLTADSKPEMTIGTKRSEDHLTSATPKSESSPPQKRRKTNKKKKRTSWAEEEDDRLREAVKALGFAGQWNDISERVRTRTASQCAQRWRKCLRPELAQVRRGKWVVHEDNTLRQVVQQLGTQGLKIWENIAQAMKWKRSPKQCRERWFNFLDPSIKIGGWTAKEDGTLRSLYQQFGSRWSKIAKHLAGRTADRAKQRLLMIANV